MGFVKEFHWICMCVYPLVRVCIRVLLGVFNVQSNWWNAIVANPIFIYCQFSCHQNLEKFSSWKYFTFLLYPLRCDLFLTLSLYLYLSALLSPQETGNTNIKKNWLIWLHIETFYEYLCCFILTNFFDSSLALPRALSFLNDIGQRKIVLLIY